MSVNLLGQCISDCKTADPTVNSNPTTSTPGYHEDTGKCQADNEPDSGAINHACTPVTSGSSVNLITQQCKSDCPTPTTKNHLFNGYCVVDGAPLNLPCLPVTKGSSLDINGNCTKDCKSITDSSTSVNTPAWHDIEGKCLKDSGKLIKLASAFIFTTLVIFMNI